MTFGQGKTETVNEKGEKPVRGIMTRMKDQSRSGVSAIVLAAGSSTRMGTLKPLVHIGGEPMLQRVLSALHWSRVDEIVVVLGYGAQLVKDTILFGEARIVMNDAYKEGMSTSIQLGLANVRDDAKAALVVLADQPFLKADSVDKLILEYQHQTAQIVVPVYCGVRGNPVLLDRSVFHEVAALRGDVGFRAIFGSHTREILKVPIDDAGVLVDLDTTAEVERVEQAGIEKALPAELFDRDGGSEGSDSTKK